MVVSSAELEYMGAQVYARLRTDAAQKGVLNTDAAMWGRVRAIASRLYAHDLFRPDAAT